MPPCTPYEAELRERLARSEQRCALYERLAAAQEACLVVARSLTKNLMQTHLALSDALAALDRESGKILFDSMPPELRAALTGPSAFEEGLKAQDGPLFPGMNGDTIPAEPTVPRGLDVDGLARDLELAGPLEVEQLAGHGWPAGWADYAGISDQEIVWPVQPKGQPVPGGTPIAAFASHAEQALYWRLRNAAPALLAIARAAEALRDVSVAHYRWCRKAHSGDSNECTCDASRANERLDALRRALGLDGV